MDTTATIVCVQRFWTLIELMRTRAPSATDEQLVEQFEADMDASGLDVCDAGQVDIAVGAQLNALRARAH